MLYHSRVAAWVIALGAALYGLVLLWPNIPASWRIWIIVLLLFFVAIFIEIKYRVSLASTPPLNSSEMANYADSWFWMFMTWQVIHWVLLVLVTGGSAAVASKFMASHHSDAIALLVAVLGAVYTALNPGQRAEAYREAWVTLHLAILKDAEGAKDKQLEAYRRGEEIIGRRPTPSK